MGPLPVGRARLPGPHAIAAALLLGLVPSAPPGDIVGQIENAIFGFFQSIWNGISGFFGSIFSSFESLISQIFLAPVNAIQSAWATLELSVAGFGPFAPIVTILVVLAVVLVVVFVIWLVIRLSVSEGEETLGEAEEGE